MTCSICQQSGHNKQTCSVVIKYEYDDCGVRCRINPNDEGDYQPVETYCLPCGSPTQECDCGKYKCGKWFNEEKGKFQGTPRRSSPRPKKITPKPACADCGDAIPDTAEIEQDWNRAFGEMKLRLIFALFGIKDEKEKKHYIICDECERLCHTGEVQYTGGYCCEKCDIWGIAGRTATRISEEEEDN